MSRGKAILCLMIFVVGMIGNSTAEGTEGEYKMEIQSSAFILKIDKVAGGLISLIDRESGGELLAPVEQPVRLFEIAGEDAWFSNNAEALSSINITNSGTEQTLTIEYDFKKPLGSFFVSVHIKADSQQPDIEFGISLANKVDGLIVESVRFPVIDVKRHLDDSKTDMAFIPGGDGTVIRGTKIDDTWGVKDYPGSGSMQLTAYYNDNIGIGLECHDTSGEPKRIGYFHNSSYGRESVHVVCTHLTSYEANAEIAEYPIVIFPVKGSWYEAAEHYKKWALKQWWAKPKNMKKPEWTYKNPVVIESDLRPQYCGLRTMPLDKYSEILDAWSDLFGESATLLPLYRGFARYGTYVSPHYFPLYPDEETLGKVFSDVHSTGHRNMAMVTGMVWMKERAELVSGGAYWVEGFDGMVESENGEMIDGWTDVSPSGPEVCVVTKEGEIFETHQKSWSGTRSQMCPGHPYTKQVLVKLAEKMGELGLDLFLLDQMNGGRSQPCYSKEHSHPPGIGPWAAEAVAELMLAVKMAGRAKNPDFTLSLEDPGELWLPYLDIVGFRPAAVNGWPAPSVSSQSATQHGYIEPFSYTVPAFGYVYGHLVRPQTWDIGINSNHPRHKTNSAQKAALGLARTFVSGSTMAFGIAPWMLVNQYAPPPEGWSHEKDPTDKPYGLMYSPDAIAQLPDRAYEPHLKLLRNTVMIAGGPALEYLNHGSMIKPPKIDSPIMTFVEWGWDDEAKKGVERKWRDNAIHYNAWKLEDRTALLLVNADLEKAYSISLPVDEMRKISIYRNTEDRIVCTGMKAKKVMMQPCEALMIEYMTIQSAK